MKLHSNAHTHTTWCDGANTPDEMARAALQLGFTGLGFSSHAPAPFDPTCPGVADEQAYRADIARLKEEYSGVLSVLCGIEQDRLTPVNPEDYDYIILSNHFLSLPHTVYAVDYTPETLRRALELEYGGNALSMVRAFYRQTVEGVLAGRPDIVGHFDLITKFNRGNTFFDEESATYQKVALEALDEVIPHLSSYGGLLELNTGAMFKGLRDCPYPAPFLLRHAAARHARVIITSDCHKTEQLDGCFDAAQALMAAAGFRTHTVLQAGKFEEVMLAP